MVSDLPPRLRDTTDIQDRVRQDRANLSQLFVGFQGGRFPPSKRLGIDASQGIFDNSGDEDDEDDVQTPEWEWDDRHYVTVAGGQIAQLSKTPLDESLQVYWHPRGLAYTPVRWTSEKFTVNGSSVTIPDAAVPLIEVGDAFSFHYQYLTGEPGPELIDFNSNGWTYQQISSADNTDYSSPTYDDSAWSIGKAAFGGYVVGASITGHEYDAYGGFSTTWTNATRMWLRRVINFTAGADIQLTVRVDNFAVVYWNGVQIDSFGNASGFPFVTNPRVILVPGASVTGIDLLAIRATDGATIPGGNLAAVDAKIEGLSVEL